jgi:hypothetical protein
LVSKAEKNYIHSVKSTYKLCVEERPSYWSGIWKLKVPPKINNLVWCMCRGCLSTRVRLQDKGVEFPVNCVSWNDEADDLEHVFFHYPFAVQAWWLTVLWDEVSIVIKNSTTADKAIFVYSINCRSTFNREWLLFYGVFGSTAILNFGKTNMSFVFMLLIVHDT